MAKTDLEIAQECILEPIQNVGEKIGIPADALEMYGKYKAKLSFDFVKSLEKEDEGKLILVTAINPTKAGEGKSTTTVGLGDGLNRLNKKTMMALREPSLGPVFGLKGGAAGGGYAQVVPMEDINLHFTGDMHAITTANNLLSAMIDNHMYQGNELNLDPERITFKRCLDMNDRILLPSQRNPPFSRPLLLQWPSCSHERYWQTVRHGSELDCVQESEPGLAKWHLS